MITGFSERSLYTQAELPEQSCCRLPVWAPVFPEASAWHWEVNKNANPTESPCVPVLKGQGLAGVLVRMHQHREALPGKPQRALVWLPTF